MLHLQNQEQCQKEGCTRCMQYCYIQNDRCAQGDCTKNKTCYAQSREFFAIQSKIQKLKSSRSTAKKFAVRKAPRSLDDNAHSGPDFHDDTDDGEVKEYVEMAHCGGINGHECLPNEQVADPRLTSPLNQNTQHDLSKARRCSSSFTLYEFTK